MITVKLVELGSAIQEYCLEDSSCVGDLLEVAGKTFVQGSVTRNNTAINKGATLYNNDRIFLGRATKGNVPFEVNFMRLGSSSVNLPAEDGYTIKRTLEQLGAGDRNKFYRPDGSVVYEFRVSGSGRPVDENYVLNHPVGSDSIRVICAERVKGN